MAIGGKIKEVREFQKKVGMGEFEPLAFNPTKAQLETLLDTTLDKDVEYLGEDKEGVAYTRIAIYMREVHDGEIYSTSTFIRNKIQKNSEEKEIQKTQWINDIGDTTWMEDGKDEDDLPEWFAKKSGCRKAYEGEADLYRFLRAWLQIDFTKDDDAVCVVDPEKLFKGNVGELQELVGSRYTTIKRGNRDPKPATVVMPVSIKTKPDGTDLMIIDIRKVLPGYTYNEFVGKRFTRKDFDRLVRLMDTQPKSKDDWEAIKEYKPWQRTVAEMFSETYPYKTFFGKYLSTLRDYDPAENLVTSSSVVNDDEDDSTDY